MLSKKMSDALNEQMKWEIYSGYLYMAMAAHFDSANLPGFATWMKLQAKEEWAHAMKFYEFINERGGRAVFHAFDQPPVEYASPLAAFEMTLEHEKEVTAKIHRLYELAVAEDDKPAQVFLHWFIEEQVEEESTADGIVEKLKMVGDAGHAIIMIDRELGARAG